MRVRRSPHLIACWRHGTLAATNYATGDTCVITPFICQVLDSCSAWSTPARIGRLLGVPADAALIALIDRLISLNCLECAGRPLDSRVRAMAALDAWNPEAGFFHTSTRDVRFATTRQAARQATLQELRRPMPPVVKRYPRATPAIALPKPRADGEFPRVLRARRTSRRFSSKPVSRADLATLLGLTAGVQQWATSGQRELALKTSPSGGARHSLEAYVVIRDVDGLRSGIYHYAADRHALERLRGPVPLQRMRDYLPNSGYFANASFMVFFAALFERILWRYPYSRAYRAALVEAGHLCQTFCLTATWLGLAPYCVMGLADSLIEQDLGIDGIRESVLYCAGVGRPPGRLTSAPLPRGSLVTRPNPKV
jgi:SagB-type dehydrogenase family enzyme